MVRAKDEVTITPLKKHSLFLFCCGYYDRDNLQLVTSFFFADTKKKAAAVWYTLAFTQSVLALLLRLRAVIERSKPFTVACLQWIQDQQ